ncbi:hypothetical protein PVK06_043791 [Gossypium arboreum]|uniref:Uncharacterized protein n=1 Tax=Gossypium arboreum TaxID=29729 RepID=A0ABR0MPQ6_GOSAR|nr:hypothetical protein PVK06_043791 [Gossypium arboreum]
MKGSGPLVAIVLVASIVALTSSSSAEVQHVSFSPTSSNQIGPLRCWPGGLCLSRSIGDMDVGEFIVPVPYVKQVKAVIRGLLLSTLDDPNRKLCIAISMAIAAIAVYDWPKSWLDLLPFLLKLIGDQTSMNGGKKYSIRALINTIAFCFLILNIFSSCFGGLIAVLDGLRRCLFL